MSRLVLVRHGQSEWNAQRRIQGHAGTGLTEIGRQQATVTADWVARTYPDATLVSSDLPRCVETAAPIADALDVDAMLDARLRERSFGRWESAVLEDVMTSDPDLWARWRVGEDIVEELGGESAQTLAARVTGAMLDHATAAGSAGTVVLVTHGGPIWHGLHAMLTLPWGTLATVANAGVTELVLDGSTWRCESWNQTAHMPPHLRTSFRPSENATENDRT